MKTKKEIEKEIDDLSKDYEKSEECLKSFIRGKISALSWVLR